MKPHPQPARIPESMGPDDIGPHLRSLREQFRLSVQDVSERLHIRVRYVNAIEEAHYENMPGKVYARGYVHTYAEFLGLDAEQVVQQCFPPVQTASASTAVAAAQPAVRQLSVAGGVSAQSMLRPFRLVVAGGVALVLFWLGNAVFSGGSTSDAAEEVSAVAPVPEALLASLRSEVMPVAQNYDCFVGTGWLDCFFVQRDVQQFMRWQAENLVRYEAEVAAALEAAKAASSNPEPEAAVQHPAAEEPPESHESD